MRMRTLIQCGALLGAVGLGACELVVINPNNPSQVQVKGTPSDLDNFLGSLYRRWHSGLYGVTGNVWGMMNIMSFENYSTLANNCQNRSYPVPDASPADNQIGNACGGEQGLIYNRHSETGRGAADVLRRMNEGLSFGSPGQDARNRAFAEFIRGLSLGYLSLVYDSSAVIKPDDPLTPAGTAEPGELAKYTAVFEEAMVAFQNALDAASDPAATGPGGFALPSNWMFTNQPSSVTATEFIKILRSYRARIRASLARYPNAAACAAGGSNNVCADEITADDVDWAAVAADAQNGITSDLRITTSTVTGPNMSWVAQWLSYTTWHQMTPFISGMADTTGAYAAWLALPIASRGVGSVFFMQTPDQRWPKGADRAAQRADLDLSACSNPNQVCKRFFVNRATADPVTNTWGVSQYDFGRFISWRTSGTAGTGQDGPFPFFTKAELDLLQAEALFRQQNYAAVLPLVNRTRTACGPGGVPAGCTARPAGSGLAGEPGGGLPALVAADNTTPIPGGNACVPKRAVNGADAGGGTVVCGTLWDALKWEKRMEAGYTHFAPWFMDSRRWGDLADGVPVDWPTPYQDLQVRLREGLQIYSTGGPNPYHRSAGSSYGW
ncbi:MAG: hypothetical protein ACT4PM_10470 [Gemmatimonadales bacterium]